MLVRSLKTRLERVEDEDGVRAVVESAFGRSAEADLVDQLRNLPGTFALVATLRDEVIGYLMFSTVQIAGMRKDAAACGLAPLAVSPRYQRQGVGSALMKVGVREALHRGIAVVVVLGHREYYPRFGFKAAATMGLTCRWSSASESFMFLELIPGVLVRQKAHVTYASPFDAF